MPQEVAATMTILSDKRPHHPQLTDEEMEEILWEMIEDAGGLKQLDEDMTAFKQTNRKFSKDYSSLVKLYNNQWVAYYDSRFQAHADSHKKLLEKIKAMGVPRDGSVIRYVTDRPEKWIL